MIIEGAGYVNTRMNLKDPFMNKGTAFSMIERKKLGLMGTLPSVVHSLEEQVEIEYLKIKQHPDDFSKSKYLTNLYNINRTLYFAVVEQHIKELLPIIYTPTIADSVMSFSENYLWNNDALYLDSEHPSDIEEKLTNATQNFDELDLMVITDGEGVLGIGDWGINGVMISVGKLCVYTVAAGINPKKVLPVIIDNGTNRQELLKSPIYLGKKKNRLEGEKYLQFIDHFVEVSTRLFPNILLHWEDFGRDNAQIILDRYKDRIVTFNDDIQGTGVTVVAAVTAALTVKKSTYRDQKFVIFGAGTAGVGISEQIENDMIVQGLTKREAKDRIYLVDKNGLVCQGDTDITEGQKAFARSKGEFSHSLSSLEKVIEIVQPSFLIGTSGQSNAFGEKIVKMMSSYQDNPAIFPMSNPSVLAEATAADIIRWTKGKALVVTGSPSEPVIFNDNQYKIGQANNALFYPGLGLGIIASGARNVTNRMLSEAAHAVSEIQNLDHAGCSLLPEIKNLRECSIAVAKAVFLAAVEDGVSLFKESDIEQKIEEVIWTAKY